jgi:hypothetical protein
VNRPDGLLCLLNKITARAAARALARAASGVSVLSQPKERQMYVE